MELRGCGTVGSDRNMPFGLEFEFVSQVEHMEMACDAFVDGAGLVEVAHGESVLFGDFPLCAEGETVAYDVEVLTEVVEEFVCEIGVQRQSFDIVFHTDA